MLINNKISERVIVLLKNDAYDLMKRIRDRQKDYIVLFAVKRTREHFKEIFRSKFDTASIADLMNLDPDYIEALYSFHRLVDEIRWYFTHTEDMPNTVEEYLINRLKGLEKAYKHLDGQGLKQITNFQSNFEELPPPPPLEKVS